MYSTSIQIAQTNNTHINIVHVREVKLSQRIGSVYRVYMNVMHVVAWPAMCGLLRVEPVQHACTTAGKEAAGVCTFFEYSR